MFPVDRRRRILQRVAERQTIRIGELARELGVSEMTIRRDIGRLEQDGFLRQTYGGATAHITKSIELAFNARALDHAAEKRLIGMRAADDLAATPVLYVGPGTTTEQFTLYLPETAGPHIITGSLPVASRLGSRSARVIALGGTVSEEELACVGPIATAALARYRTDVAVIGAAGVSARFGVTEMDDSLAEVNRAALAHTARVVVLADASKIGTDSHAIVAPPSAIGMLVTSVGAPPDELARLRAAGIDVQVVGVAVHRQRSARRTGQANGANVGASSSPDGRHGAVELAADGAHRRGNQGKEAGR